MGTVLKLTNGSADAMSISPARIAAFDILLQVEREDAYASELLHSPKYLSLSREDHGLATQIVMGVLRWRSQLDATLASSSSHPLPKLDAEVRTALRMGSYQIMHLERVPSHAAVHESVELVKRARKTSAAGLVNALLRKIPRGTKSEAAPGTAKALAKRYAHPEWMVARWVDRFGLETACAICASNQQVPATSVRIPSSLEANATVTKELLDEGVHLASGALLASARRVESGDITKTKAFNEGRAVIQDEASQLVAILAGEGSEILDCCAAPGGKTMVIAERNPTAKILAMDIHPHRARLLRSRVHALNVHVIAADLQSAPLRATFDRVLLDAPCSGTGTLAQHPEIKWRLKLEHIAELQALQKALLAAAMKLVAPGGTLLYSTCSLEREENEDVVEQVLTGFPDFRVKSLNERLVHLNETGVLTINEVESLTSGAHLRTLPGLHPCDGFFAALLEKV